MTGLPLGYFRLALLAVHDLIHANDVLSTCFGAVPLAGTVTVAPGSTTVLGAGTDFVADLKPSQRVRIGGSVHYVAEILSPSELELSTGHVAGVTDAPMDRAAQVWITDFPDPLPIGPPYCILTGEQLPPTESAVGTRTLDPVIQAHYFIEPPYTPLTDIEPMLWDVGSYLARVLTAPGVPGISSAAWTLSVPRMSNRQLAAAVNPASLGITSFEPNGLRSQGYEFTYKSIAQAQEVADQFQPLW